MNLWEGSRYFVALVAVAALALFATGCDGDSDDEGSAISGVIADAVMTDDHRLFCEDLIASDYVVEIYGDVEACIEAKAEAVEDAEKADEVIVTEIEVDGDEATATVQEVGGDTDGAAGTVSLIREDEQWRISELGINYLRSTLTQGFANTEFTAEDAPLDDEEFRDCFGEHLQELDDQSFRAMAYASMADEPLDPEFMGAFADCIEETGIQLEPDGSDSPMGEAPDGTAEGPMHDDDVSVIRQQFERGIAKSVREDGVSEEALGCILAELRGTVSDDQIVDEVARDGDDVSPELMAAVARAMANC